MGSNQNGRLSASHSHSVLSPRSHPGCCFNLISIPLPTAHFHFTSHPQDTLNFHGRTSVCVCVCPVHSQKLWIQLLANLIFSPETAIRQRQQQEHQPVGSRTHPPIHTHTLYTRILVGTHMCVWWLPGCPAAFLCIVRTWSSVLMAIPDDEAIR